MNGYITGTASVCDLMVKQLWKCPHPVCVLLISLACSLAVGLLASCAVNPIGLNVLRLGRDAGITVAASYHNTVKLIPAVA